MWSLLVRSGFAGKARRVFATALSPVAAVLCAAVPLLACVSVAQVKQSAVDAAISTAAPRPSSPASPPAALAGYSLFAGDFHTHVSPPDGPPHVVRGMHETVVLARKEHLDFVVLTPHTWSRFFLSAPMRAQVIAHRNEMRRALAAEDIGGVLFVVGAEYTDGAYGHVGMAFGDLDRTLAEVPVASASAHADAFFEHYVANGGLLTVNHPLVGPIDSAFEMARADLSWRMYTAPDQAFPPEVRAVTRLSFSYEAYNTTATELRDRILLSDRDLTLRATLALYDGKIEREKRRITPVGGSDSHSHYLRATTFVAARALTEPALREAIQAGRTCIRSADACTLEARVPGGAFVGVGGALADANGVVEVRARGSNIAVFASGTQVATPASGEIARVAVARDRCVAVRAMVGDGYSAPIYVNCGL